MKRLIWDIPTRIFHWAFALFIIVAFLIGKFVEEDSAIFAWHIFFGLLIGVLMCWRIMWAFVGSKNSHFGVFKFSFNEIKSYFLSQVKDKGEYYARHNPAGAAAAVLMVFLASLSVLSGIGMGVFGEVFEEIHEIITLILMIVAGVHVLGVVIATVKHRENYVMGMITGRKKASIEEALLHGSPVGAVVLVAILAFSGSYVLKGLDFEKKIFTPPGTQWQLKFAGEDHKSGAHRDNDRDHDDD